MANENDNEEYEYEDEEVEEVEEVEEEEYGDEEYGDEEIDDDLDSFVVNLKEAETPVYKPIKPGWYRVMVTAWSSSWPSSGKPVITTKPDGKMPQGTRGTVWQFQVVDDEQYEGKSITYSLWHHPQSVGYWKTLYMATGLWSEDELDEDLNILAMRDEIVDNGVEMAVRLGVRKGNEEYGPSNVVRGFKHLDEYESDDDI